MVRQEQVREPLPAFSGGFTTAKDLRLAQLRIPSAEFSVLSYLSAQTSGQAHIHRAKRRIEPGMWCDFNLAAWSDGVPMDKSNLRRALAWLVEHQIIWLTQARGEGRIGWNPNTHSWVGKINHGGSRPGTGAPKGNQNARKTIKLTTEDGEENNQNDHRINQVDYDDSIKLTTQTIKMTTESIKLTTSTTLEASNDAALSGPLDTYGIRVPTEQENIHTHMSELAAGEPRTRVRDQSSLDSPVSSKTSAKRQKAPPQFAEDSDAYLVAKHLRAVRAKIKPNDSNIPHTPAQMQKWAAICDLILRVDKHEPAHAHALIEFAAQDLQEGPKWYGWQPVIQGPESLRRNWGKLSDSAENAAKAKSRAKTPHPAFQSGRNEPPSVMNPKVNPFERAQPKPNQPPSL